MAGDFDCCIEPINRQEHPMTSPTQRRHDEILGRLDALIDAVQSTTARDHLHRLLAEESAAERRDEPVDTAPDVDPDEARVCFTDECGEPCQSLQEQKREEITTLRREVWKLSRRLGDERGHVKELEADVERLTRERDKWLKVAKEAGSRANSEATHRAAADARYEALRADVEVYRDGIGDRGSPSIFSSVPWAAVKIRLETILDRDDERAK